MVCVQKSEKDKHTPRTEIKQEASEPAVKIKEKAQKFVSVIVYRVIEEVAVKIHVKKVVQRIVYYKINE